MEENGENERETPARGLLSRTVKQLIMACDAVDVLLTAAEAVAGSTKLLLVARSSVLLVRLIAVHLPGESD
ncbi:MAG: hypothetical protein ACRDQZ_14565 [Mycobacteriales bacterium]